MVEKYVENSGPLTLLLVNRLKSNRLQCRLLVLMKHSFPSSITLVPRLYVATNEYERQEPAPRRGSVPPVLIFQTSHL